MLPRHAWSRVAASRVRKYLGRTYIQAASSSTASVTSTHRVNGTHSALPNDTNLRTIFDKPFSNPHSSSASLTPTGLFGNATLRSPNDFILLAYVTIKKAKTIVARITKAPEAGPAEMRMVLRNFDRLSDVLCGVIDTAELVRHVHPDPEWVEASNEAYGMLCSYMNVLNTHTSLYQVLSTVMADPTIASTFTPEERAAALIFRRDFERSGIDLPPTQRAEFVSLSSEIITLGRQFLLDGPGPRGHVDVPIAKLRDSIGTGFRTDDKRTRRRAQELMDSVNNRVSRLTGKVRVHGGSWEAHMLLKYCADEDVRRDMYSASFKGNPGNVETLEALLRARLRLAQLVGKSSYAEITLTDKMAKNPDHVTHFLRALNEHHRPLALAEVSKLAHLQAPNLRFPSTSARIEAWDRDYYSTRLRSSSSTDTTSSRPPALSLGTVFQSLSEFFAQVFGLRLRVVDISPGETWHTDVQKLEVFSVDNGDVMGWIFADLFARSGKQAGAAHYTVRCSRRLDKDDWLGDLRHSENHGTSSGAQVTHASEAATTMRPRRVKGKEGMYQLPIAVLSCDFSKPTVRDGASMLRWHDIETLFHEMGHALHSMVGQTEYHNVAGTRCATDFVELPSILMEHFLASPAVQSLLVGRPLEKSIPSSRAHGVAPALDAHNQILLAMLDQVYHSSDVASPSFSSTSTLAHMQNTRGVIPYAPGTAWQLQFSHLYGYGATYYSYLFDQAIASRVFHKVFEENPLDREKGDRYINEVLKHGGGKDPWTMVGRLLEDDEFTAGDQRAMEMVGKWGIDANLSISQ